MQLCAFSDALATPDKNVILARKTERSELSLICACKRTNDHTCMLTVGHVMHKFTGRSEVRSLLVKLVEL